MTRAERHADTRRRLMAAIEQGSDDDVRELIESNDIDVDFVDPSSGLSPLQLAVYAD